MRKKSRMDTRLLRVPSDLPMPPSPSSAEGLVGVEEVDPSWGRARRPSFDDLRTLASQSTFHDVVLGNGRPPMTAL